MRSKNQIFTPGVVSLLLALALLSSFPTMGFSEDYYGAIACTRNCAQWTSVNNSSSQQEAEAKAVADCQQKYGSKCKSVHWFKNACGALATASNGSWAADWGNSEDQVRQKVLDSCSTKYNGKDCKISILECTDW